MNTQDLEGLLNGAEETDALEFKGPMEWHSSLIKDILALANVRDGGRIIVGIEDETFRRVGVTNTQIATFNNDILRDRVAPYADPRVELRCEVVSDIQGLRFVIIDVSPFETTPVICRRDGEGLQAGAIYYRSRAGRPASARVARSDDMRDVIEVAIVRSRRRLERIGIFEPVQKDDQYDRELGGL